MHRVVNLTSNGFDTTVISNHKDTIKTEIEKYSLHKKEVNDGTNEKGNPTLGVNADFNDATEANTFHSWLKTYIQNNSDDFEYARTRVHDCYHADGQSMPCKLGDVWEL